MPGKIKGLTLLMTLFGHLMSCPFSNYEDGLLNSQNPIYEEDVHLISDTLQSLSFGFWSFCIPLWEPQNYPIVLNQFQTNQPEIGQLFFLMTFQDVPIIMGYLSFDLQLLTVNHNIEFRMPQSQKQKYVFQYSPATYEGKWIFTFLSTTTNSILIQLTEQNQQIITVDLSQTPNVKFIIGGRGMIVMNQATYNLNIFRGRLSKLLIETNGNNFSQLSTLCQIPQKVVGEQNIKIVQGLQLFKGDKLLQFEIDEIGLRYCLSGWVKYDASQVVNFAQYTLIRLSAFKNYQYMVNLGDELFTYKVQIQRQNPIQTYILALVNPYNIPKVGPVQFDYSTERNNFWAWFWNFQDDRYLRGLQQWHYLKYEYGRTSQVNQKMFLQIKFFNEVGLQQVNFAFNKRMASFINTKYYLFFGGDDTTKDLLQAQIQDFEFKYNYNEDKQFLINVCHYSCLNCNGPSQNNCIDCQPDSNRIFLIDQKICKCKDNYIDFQGETQCKFFNSVFQSVIEKETAGLFGSQCGYGYFEIHNTNSQIQCIQCPKYNSFDILCVDCLINPQTWYKRSICTQDLISRKSNIDDAYTLTDREDVNKDIYIINQNYNLIILEGVLDICYYKNQYGCFQTEIFDYLGKKQNVICKETHYFTENRCQKPNPQCKKSDKFGNCLLCADHWYLKDNQCLQCHQTCNSCQYDNFQTICTSCYERYILHNGQCIECGINCQICKMIIQDDIPQQRCFKCVNDQKYYLSLDGVNCLLNQIQNCQYAFQVLKSDLSINSLDYNYQSQKQSNEILTYCGLCSRTEIFIMSTQTCDQGIFVTCDFGYAIESDPDEYSQYCLIAQQQYEDTTVVQFQNPCAAYSQNCDTCLQTNNIISCLTCQAGYYMEKLSGKCYKCPEDLHCYQCIQQDSTIKDGWKDYLRAFYRFFIDRKYFHPFSVYGQSQDPQDYEIVCSICQPNYEFFENQCIPSCPESCLECQQIDGQNICVKCQLELNGRRQSLVNNQCIQCPQNCALCRQRNQLEIKKINPLFNNLEFQYYTNECLQSFTNKNYFYDQEIGQYIDCHDIQNGCQKEFIIQLQLFCNEVLYYDQLNQMSTDEQRIKFQQENILISDLFSGSSFSQFYNNEFYSMANQKQIKIIIIQITGESLESCTLTGSKVLQQSFSANIFSTNYVELQMDFSKNIIISYDNILTFENFSKISLRGITFQPINNQEFKQILFRSSQPQKVIFNSIIYQSQFPIDDQSTIMFYNLLSLLIDGFKIQHLVQTTVGGLLYISQTDGKKELTFKNINITDSIIQDQILFFLNVGSDDIINFDNLSIQSQFKNVTLISTQLGPQIAMLTISNFQLEGKLINCESFLDLYRLKSVTILNMWMKKSILVSSTLLYLNNLSLISNFNLENTNLTENSICVTNSDSLSHTSFDFVFQDFSFINNIYDENTKFLSLYAFDSKESNISLIDLSIIGNSAFNISKDFNYQQINSSLIYVALSQIDVTGLVIQRGFGLMDITLSQASRINLKQIKITQHQNFRFQGLHQYLDCQLKQVQGQYFLQSLFIFSSKLVIIDDLEIVGAEVYNSPLITIQSAEISTIQQSEEIIINNLVAKSNLLLLTQFESQTALIQLSSTQKISLMLSNSFFQENILHEYVQNQLTQSAALLYIDCLKGNISFQNSQIISNIVTNSSDSIIYINSLKLQIIDCKFDQNGIFKYSLIQPYLLWGFKYIEQVTLIDLKRIFQIKSFTGNGYFIGQIIEINTSNISNSSGLYGGGFYITALKNSIISLFNSQISNIQTNFNIQDESGGGIYFDGSKSQSFSLLIENLNISNISSRFQGGFLYLQAGQSQANVKLHHIFASNLYSLQGSIMYVEFSNLDSSLQILEINSLFIQNSFDNQLNFLNKFTNISKSELSQLVNNRTAIYILNGEKLVFQNIKILFLTIESAFYLSNAQAIFIYQLQVSYCSFSKNFINIIARSLSKSLYIISELFIINSQVGKQLTVKECPSTPIQSQTIYFQCLQLFQEAPPDLDTLKEKDVNDQDNCLINNFNNFQDLTNQGLIVFTDLNRITQFKLDEIIFQNIDCKNCEKGLLSAIFSENEMSLSNIVIEQLTISSSQCGQSSCLLIMNGLINSRMLQQTNDYELKISHYDCINNTAADGTCIMISNINTLISNSNFKQNVATNSGGSIKILGSKQFIIENSLIEENTAQIGGGIFLEQLMLNYTKLGTTIQNNTAKAYGDDYVSTPTHLTISLNGKLQETKQWLNDNLTKIDIAKINQKNKGQQFDVLYLPTGQIIGDYQYYNWKTSTYIPLNISLRLLALNDDNIVQKNIQKSSCTIKSRLYSTQNQTIEFTSNYTNYQDIYFNDLTADYNLDNLIIYFDPEAPNDTVLQLQFNCSSIKIPIISSYYPYNIIGYHNNYSLRLNIKSFPCQLGEIKQNNICTPCDSNQGLFSLQINSQKCSIQDEVSTINVKPASLNLKKGFWRPYLDTVQINYCINLPENCLGGWIEGDTSCFIGHIGALCEQCDIYNTRGNGQYSLSRTYSCSTCDNMIQNSFLIGIISFWTLTTILLSVKSTLRAIKQFARIVTLQKLGQAVSLETSQSAILIKMLTNFLQILATLSTFQLAIPVGIDNTINAVGNPIQTMAYSLDCLLVKMFEIQIHYARMIWQLILPFIYITIFLFSYKCALKLKLVDYNSSVIFTTLIYMYIYLQPNLIGGLVQLISFRNVSGFSWIQANVSQRYDTSYHIKWMFEFCLPTLLILAIIIPLYMFKGLYTNRFHLNRKQIRLCWGYLYNEYKKTAYYWEIIKIIEKQLIIIFLIYFQDIIVIKGILIQIIILVYKQLNEKHLPYSSKMLNKLDASSARICAVSIALGLGIYISQEHQLSSIQIPLFMILIVINFYFLVTIITKILSEIIKQRFNIDCLRNSIIKYFPILNSAPFIKRFLENRVQQRNRVANNYRKIKQFLIPQAKTILAFKDFYGGNSKQFIESNICTLRNQKDSSERQQLIRNTFRMSPQSYASLMIIEQQKNEKNELAQQDTSKIQVETNHLKYSVEKI